MKLTHMNEEGRATMVDITKKKATYRVAVAQAVVTMKKATLKRIIEQSAPKGDVLAVAQIAGIQAAKQTHTLIPMCHPLLLTKIDLSFTHSMKDGNLKIISRVSLDGKTGVEMEALTAVSVAALTVYDMCKAIDKDMTISDMYLIEKYGGKSGHYINDKAQNEED